jgi:putative transposase
MESLHNSELGGHLGEKATYNRIKLLFHWPGMKQQVVHFIKHCLTCQINKPRHYKYPGLLQPLPIPDFS